MIVPAYMFELREKTLPSLLRKAVFKSLLGAGPRGKSTNQDIRRVCPITVRNVSGYVRNAEVCPGIVGNVLISERLILRYNRIVRL